MGVSKIHPIRFTLSKALNYIMNPAKTEDGKLLSAFQCTPDAGMAETEFRMTARLAEKMNREKTKFSHSEKKNILAYHMIQSFDMDDNLTPEQVHEIGKEWADEVLGGKFEYVIATHIDTNNLHNHIIFNAVSIEDLSKWHVWNDAKLLRDKNDLVRRRHGLNITQARQNERSKNPKYHQSFRQQIRKSINECIRKSEDFEQFKQHLAEHGVEMKEEKYLSFRVEGQQRFTRDRSLGDKFSRAAIEKRIEKQHAYRNRVAKMARSTKLAATKELANTLLLMRSESIQQFSDFDARMESLQQDILDCRSTMSRLKGKVHQHKQAVQLIRLYNELKPIADQSENKSKAGFQKRRFDKQHEKELQTFETVNAKLKQLGLRTDISDEKLKHVLENKEDEVMQLEVLIDQIAKRAAELAKAKDVVARIEKGEQFVFARDFSKYEQSIKQEEKKQQRRKEEQEL